MAGHSWGGYGFYYSMASITAGCRGLVLAWLLMITDKHLRHRSRITPQTFGVNFQFFAVQMLLLCLYVGVGNGVTDLQHYELRTAQALQSKHPKRAYKVGDKSYATSHRLFAMRCYLMATTHKRGWATRCSANGASRWCRQSATAAN